MLVFLGFFAPPPPFCPPFHESRRFFFWFSTIIFWCFFRVFFAFFGCFVDGFLMGESIFIDFDWFLWIFMDFGVGGGGRQEQQQQQQPGVAPPAGGCIIRSDPPHSDIACLKISSLGTFKADILREIYCPFPLPTSGRDPWNPGPRPCLGTRLLEHPGPGPYTGCWGMRGWNDISALT